MSQLNQKGAIPPLVLIAAVGLVIFFAVASTVSFKNSIFSFLFPKPSSFAAETVIRDTPLRRGTPGSGASFSLESINSNLGKDCSFSIPLTLDTGNNKTYRSDIVINFDPSKVIVTAISKGFLYPNYSNPTFDNTTGKINISATTNTDLPFSGKGIFAFIDFKVNPKTVSKQATVDFEFTPGNNADSNVLQAGTNQDILSTTLDGLYNIDPSKSCH